MTWEPLKYVSKNIHPTALKKFDPSTYTLFGHYFLQILRIDLQFEGPYGSGTLEFFLKGTSDKDLKALKVRIKKNISKTLKTNSIYRLSPYFNIISYESRALIFNLRVPMVPGLLKFFLKGSKIISCEASKQGSKIANPTPFKNFRSIDYHCILASFLTNLGRCSSIHEFQWFQDFRIFLPRDLR